MKRRSFLKGLGALFGVSLVAPKLIIESTFSEYDTGYFYCPYLPLQISGTSEVVHSSVSLSTRYNKPL